MVSCWRGIVDINQIYLLISLDKYPSRTHIYIHAGIHYANTHIFFKNSQIFTGIRLYLQKINLIFKNIF